MEKQGVYYETQDKLEVNVRFYMKESQLNSLDVDNRLKSVLDALQGFVSQGKGWKKKAWPSLIPNDNQIYRAVVEKAPALIPDGNLGHLKIRRLTTAKRKSKHSWASLWK